MMGTKIRNFAPVSDLSLEELVSKQKRAGLFAQWRICVYLFVLGN